MDAISVKNIWKTYSYWALLIGIAFFTIYPTCNWLTSQRTYALALYLDSELNIPFIPEFAWAYLSMYVLFLMPPFFLDILQLKALGKHLLAGTFFSGLVFLVLSAKLGFVRIVPEEPFYRSLFTGLFAVDMPHNMVPSLHVVFSALILFALLDASITRLSKTVWWGWIVLILASTLLVHQHHLLDVFTGLVVALMLRRLIGKEGNHV